MSYKYDKETKSIIIDGFEKGIAASPYLGISNITNLNTSYYPGVSYTNYKRLGATINTGTETVILYSFNAGATAASGTTVATTQDCGGTNRVLLAFVSVQTGDTISSVVATSGAMIQIGSSVNGADANQRISTWGLLAPSLGTQTITVTRNNSSGIIGVSSAAFYGCRQTTLPDNVTQTTGANSATTTFTTSTNNDYVLSYAASVDINAGTGETLIGRGAVRTVVVTNTSTTTWTCPAGVTSVTLDVWGGGGAGGAGNPSGADANGGGGGGGAYSKKVLTVVPATVYTVTVGAGGTNVAGSGTAGGDSWFSTSGTVLAKGGSPGTNSPSGGNNGAGGLGGLSASGIGDTVYGGGNGSGGGAATTSGAGGGGAGTLGDGFNASGNTPGPGNTVGGGVGGVHGAPGTAGTTIAGGGGAGNGLGALMGNGARGQVNITYTQQSFGVFSYTSNPKTPAGSVSMTSTTTSTGSTVAQIMLSIAPKVGGSMTNPVQKAVSPVGLIYILDDSGQIWKQSAVNSSTFNYLAFGARQSNGAGGLAYWNNYLVVFGNGFIEYCGDGTGDSTIIYTNWNLNGQGAAFNSSVFTTQAGVNNQLNFATQLTTLPRFQLHDPIQFTTTGVLPSPLQLFTTYYIKAIDISNSFITVSSTVSGSVITILTDGTGTHTVTDYSNQAPNGNSTNIQLTGLAVGATSLAVSSYVNPRGVTVVANWQEASGTYNIIFNDGQRIAATFTTNSAVVTLAQPLIYYPHNAGNWTVELVNASASFYRPYVSKTDGNLYFCNGRFLGRILAQNSNIAFIPSLGTTYVVNVAVTELLSPDDSIVDIIDLKSTLVLAGNLDTYTWDYVSANVSAPSPVGEQIYRIVNLLSNIYILAGKKGNIYISNGYSSQLFYKIPDYLSSAIDPLMTFGDLMVHRSRLFFQLFVQNTSLTNVFAGIFSLIVSGASKDQQQDGLVMEAQNSYGLTPTAGALPNAVLIDNQKWSTGPDSYYSAWSNGATTGGIDYNDTTLWANYEPTIETDIIPIGQLLDKKTLGNIEFKLDRPMTTGDSIKLYFRPSLTDSYTLIGTTSTNQLSEYFPSNISQSQWAQFKIQFKCAASGSSFIPFRELRFYTN